MVSLRYLFESRSKHIFDHEAAFVRADLPRHIISPSIFPARVAAGTSIAGWCNFRGRRLCDRRAITMIVVVADSSFAAIELLDAACCRICVITPLRTDV
jgi:hypothetical protein